MSSKKYMVVVPAVLGLLCAVFGAVWALKTEDKSDDLVAIAEVLKQSSKTADAAAEVAISDGNRQVCIAAKSVSALTATAAGAVSSAAIGEDVCAIPALEIDVSACPEKPKAETETLEVDVVAPAGAATEPVVAPVAPAPVADAPVAATEAPVAPAAESEKAVDVPAIVEIAIGPVLSTLSDLAKSHDGDVTGKWIGAALDFVNGGRKSIIDIIEHPESGKLSIPGVLVQDCLNK